MKKEYRTARAIYFVLLCLTAFGCTLDTSVSDDESFTLVMLPDTQNAVDFTRQKAEGFAIDSSEIFIQQMEYIASRSVSNGGDVAFLASVGDVWQHVTSDTDPGHVARGIESMLGEEFGFTQLIRPDETLNFEIPISKQGYQLISDVGIPFGVAPGNHDYDAWWAVAIPHAESEELESIQNSEGAPIDFKIHVGGLNNFREVFGSDTDFFQDKDWYVEGFKGGGSSAQVFSAGGYRFLHLAFEMQAGDEVVTWALGVINKYPGLPTIISTHDYLSASGERLPGGDMDLALVDPEGNNSAEELWQEFISKTDQIFMVLSGHQSGQAIRIDRNDDGHEVYQILADFQGRRQTALDAGAARPTGDGWMREMIFHTRGEDASIDVRTYSSHYESYSSELSTYAEWYKEREQPDMSDEEFFAADEFTIKLSDFRSRYGMPSDL
jgi:hypothetical protein